MPETNEFGQPVGDVVYPAWEPHARPEPVDLHGRYVSLEPLADSHAPDLHATLCGPGDEASWTYRPTGPPASPDELVAVNRGWPWDGGNVSWAVLPTAAGAPLGVAAGTASGMTTFTRIDPGHGQVEVAGVIYSTALQRTAATTETTHLLMRYAFDTLDYRRVEWKCDALNEPSRRAATRLGFTFEGTFRQHMVTRGRNRDTAWFSVTDSEWPALRAIHERWLAPGNFSDDGRQLLALGALTAAWRDSPENL
ncbi:MAG: GNAT family N-acetyltransferase [Phycicoccus sp.]